MSKFAAFLKLELKRFVNKRNIIIFLLIILLSLYYVNKGIDNHKRTLEISKEFRDVESIFFKALLNYAQYASHGINLLFIPDTAEIFFTNTGKVSELTAKIDSVTTLNITNDCKSIFLFKEKYLVPMDFSGMMLLIFSLLNLFYGYDSLRDKGYLKFLTSLTSHKKVFFFVIASEARDLRPTTMGSGKISLFCRNDTLINRRLRSVQKTAPKCNKKASVHVRAFRKSMVHFFKRWTTKSLLSPESYRRHQEESLRQDVLLLPARWM